jgi:bifunctional UDP-N-acetylglucosamine pyrophosphorylase/glucosamine-1-phosphate N-acetyltransferase
MKAGISFHLPETTYLEESVEFGGDTVVGPNCSLLGRTRIGQKCEIGSHVVLKNVIIPDHTIVPAGTLQMQAD